MSTTRVIATMLPLLLIFLVVLPTVKSWSLYPGRPRSRSALPRMLKSPLVVAKEQADKFATQVQQQPLPQLNGQQEPRNLPYIPKPPRWQEILDEEQSEEEIKPLKRNSLVNSATAASLQLLTSFVPKDVTESSDRAAKIDINYLPPKSIQLDFGDIPLVGGMLSGTWAKVAPLEKGTPSIVLEPPNDMFAAIKDFLDRGRLEFDLGGLLTTQLNVDVEPNQKGVALVKLSSKLIPKWSFGSTRKSDWNRVSNMGNGETYYFNSVTGESQYEEPTEM